MMRKSFLILAVSAALTVVIFAASGSAPKAVTVGDFAVKVSRALGYTAPDQKSAVESLKGLGVSLEKKDLNARITEGEAARILSSLGVDVATESPSNDLSAAKIDSLVSAVAMTGVQSVGLEVDPPFQCRGLPPHDCKLCCLAAMPPGFLPTKNPDGICKVFCRTGFFPPSEGEPNP